MVLPLKAIGQINLKQNRTNKKFVYLISPNKIDNKDFYTDLSLVLKSKKVSFFQLRLKNETSKKKLIIGKKIKKICKKYKVKFLINDDPRLAKKLDADGCHLGQKDMNIIKARKILKKKIIYKANTKILNSVKKITNTPIVAIGGIKLVNYKKLLLNKANFLAISGYIWNNKKYKPFEAIKKLK